MKRMRAPRGARRPLEGTARAVIDKTRSKSRARALSLTKLALMSGHTSDKQQKWHCLEPWGSCDCSCLAPQARLLPETHLLDSLSAPCTIDG